MHAHLSCTAGFGGAGILERRSGGAERKLGGKDGETSGQFFGGEDLEVSWGWGRSWKVGISSGLQGEMMKPKGKIQSRLMNSCWYS